MTTSEENYLKVIYHLSLVSPKGVNTNAIAGMLETKASSVTDMMKKLSEKELVFYQKYQSFNNSFSIISLLIKRASSNMIFIEDSFPSNEL